MVIKSCFLKTIICCPIFLDEKMDSILLFVLIELFKNKKLKLS